MKPTTILRAGLAVGGVGVIALAGCSSGGTGGGTTTSAPSTAATTSAGPTSAGPTSAGPTSAGTTSAGTVTSATTPSAAASSNPSTAGTSAAAAAPCDVPGLRLSTGTPSAGAGQRYVPVIFTNTGTAPCTLLGYPGVAGIDAAGRQVTQARRATGYPVAAVRLNPGGSASAVVHATAVPSGTATSCPEDYAGLLITPPNSRMSVRVTVDLPSCSGLDVRPVVAGTTGT